MTAFWSEWSVITNTPLQVIAQRNATIQASDASRKAVYLAHQRFWDNCWHVRTTSRPLESAEIEPGMPVSREESVLNSAADSSHRATMVPSYSVCSSQNA